MRLRQIAPRSLHLNLPETLYFEKGRLFLIDQTLLPSKYRLVGFSKHTEVSEAILNMRVRGAPAIGVAAAYGMVLASREYSGKSLPGMKKFLSKAALRLDVRPTAVNLKHALDRMMGVDACCVRELRENLLDEAEEMWREDVECNEKIGENGEKLLESGDRIQTYCNAGSLATVWLGTALAPVYYAFSRGKKISVFVAETRPLLQGARLTAWELSKANVPNTLVTDNSVGWLMKKGEVSKVLVGADRVALNGDFANKIGTYSLAVLAEHHDVPFYVASPSTTIDKGLLDGEKIVLEQRSPSEVSGFLGKKVSKAGSVLNYAFDVTPGELVDGFVTERGVFSPEKLGKVFS